MGFLEEKVTKLLKDNQLRQKEIDKLRTKMQATEAEYKKLLDGCGAQLAPCKRCDGKGFMVSRSGYGGVNTDIDSCHACSGTGHIIVAKDETEPTNEKRIEVES